MSAQPYLKPTSALDRRTMGKYDVLCRLSTGGMSEIFLAYQKGLAGFRKIVVLKSILPDIRGEEEFVRMFLDEAKTTALFNHPNIATVFDLDVDGDTLFLAMEFVQGCTLVEMARACRQAKEAIPIGFTLTSVRDTALALHYAHNFVDPRGRKQTVIHRDVAEKNIMVTYDGTTKLLDFGIAKALGKTTGRTSIGMVKGTSGYMSPEQIRGEPLDARSDVFSLGVVLHECLTGMRLFHGKTPEEGMLSALREEIPPPSRLNPDVSAAIDVVVLKALTRERDGRFTTALELGRAIEKAAVGQLWHPEQSGELVQRHFVDRVSQTRQLIESTQGATGELTGEMRVESLLADLQSRSDNSGDKTRYDPDKVLLPPQAAGPVPQSPPQPRSSTVSPATQSPPQRKDSIRLSRPPPGREPTMTTDNREITDPAGQVAVPPPPRMSRPTAKTQPPSAPPGSAQITTQPSLEISVPNMDPYDDDDDDVGAKTIPAAMLPNGLFVAPSELNPNGRRPNPLPPPVPSPLPPPPPLSALQRDSGETASAGGTPTPMNGWETYDNEDDDPGVKTTIARPFDSAKPRLPLYIGIGVGVGLATLFLLLFALEMGPFAPKAGPSNGLPELKQATDKAPPGLEKPERAPDPKAAEPVKEAKEPSRSAAAVDAAKTEPREPREPRAAVEPEREREPVHAAEVETPKSHPKPARPARPPHAPRKAKAAAEEEEGSSPEAAPAPSTSQTGTLTLVMEPGLLVTLNGQEIGSTPLYNKTVPAGRQAFKVFSSSGEARTLVLDVRPGQLTSARQDFDALK